MRTEITPRLIELLEMVRREPARFADNADFAGHMYAVMLLGYFGEPRAHQVIVDLLRLPKNPIERLFGELISEEMPNILYRTCGGSLEQIKLLAQDRKAYEYSRGAALSALTFAAADGVVPREEVLELFGTLFSKGSADPLSPFWGLLAYAAYDLYPKELMDVIERAYEEELIDSFLIRYEDFQAALKDSPDVQLKRVRQEIQERTPADFHSLMSWWAMFQKSPVRPADIEMSNAPAPLVRSPAPATKPPSARPDPRRDKLPRWQRRKLERESNKASKKQRRHD